jgi:DNA-binding XRE family transcriptional regulator
MSGQVMEIPARNTQGEVRTIDLLMAGQVTKMATQNKLEEIRTKEGLSQSELARFANLSPRTISRVENGKRNVAPTTKGRIIKGLNKNPEKLKEYELEEVFPKDHRKSAGT